MSATDGELLRSIATEGNRDAFSAFYDRHSARVFGVLVKLFKNQTDAEDVLQETFLQVWNQAGRFDPSRSKPEGWILMLARSRAMDRLRKRREHTGIELADSAQLDDPGLPLQQAEISGQVCSELKLLPADQRDPIRLAYYGGLTHEEIAGRMNLPLGTVKTRIRMGMIRLRERFSREAQS